MYCWTGVRAARVMMLGEASHGTHEFYAWRAAISRRLIEKKGFSFVAVEGDWPDCDRVDPARALPAGRPGRPSGRAAGLRAVADVDVGQRGGRRLHLLAARPQHHGRRVLPSRVPRPGRVLAVGVAARDPHVSARARPAAGTGRRSEEHTSELQSQSNLVCRLLLEKKKKR